MQQANGLSSHLKVKADDSCEGAPRSIEARYEPAESITRRISGS
jgi:hypothetical protein